MHAPTAILTLCLALAAVPPLTDDQHTALDTAMDGDRELDEGSLYPLIRNAMQWPDARNVTARTNADYTQVFDEPATYRGEMFLVEGEFYGEPVRYGLERSGAWGDAVTEWVVILQRDPVRFGVVLLVDPQGKWMDDAPRRGQTVRIPARFYKVWQTNDRQGNSTKYLTFVGRYPTVTGAGTSASSDGIGAGEMVLLVVVLGAALGFLLWRSRGISFKPRPLPRQEAAAEAAAAAAQAQAHGHHEAWTDDDDRRDADANPPLPDDPASALDELSRQHDAASPAPDDADNEAQPRDR